MYDYDMLKLDIGAINPITTEVSTVGRSVMGRNIFCLKTGRGARRVLITGAHKGIESIISEFLIKFQTEYIKSILDNTLMLGIDTRSLFQNTSLYIVPMVNPDGVDIAVNGLDITNDFHRKLISNGGIHSYKRVWRGNACGTRIDTDYAKVWHRIIKNPAESLKDELIKDAPEKRAIFDLIINIKPDILITFHSKGDDVFYDFEGLACDLNNKYCISNKGKTSWFDDEYDELGFSVKICDKSKADLFENSAAYNDNSIFILDCMNIKSSAK